MFDFNVCVYNVYQGSLYLVFKCGCEGNINKDTHTFRFMLGGMCKQHYYLYWQ